jgi:hypothetical protein
MGLIRKVWIGGSADRANGQRITHAMMSVSPINAAKRGRFSRYFTFDFG